MAKNLDHEFDEYIKSKQETIADAIASFPKRLKEKKFHYGRVVIPSFYKAHFLTPEQEHLLKRVSKSLTQIINSASRLYFEDGHVTHNFRVPPEADELIRIDPGFSKTVIFSRFDAMLEGEGLKMIELNCDSPAGSAYSDQLEEIILAEEPLKDFFEKYHLCSHGRVQYILDALLETYEEYGGLETPQIAILDWRRTRTMTEYEYLKNFFEEKGYKTKITDPREVKYKSGKLYHKNFRIDIIYRRAIFDDLLLHIDEIQDLIKAYRDRAVCMVNPLRSRIASSKALLSILTNPDFDHYFTESENKIKKEYIPWTRRLVDAASFYGNKKIYLIDFLKDEKESLVLKPSLGTGGQDVTIGMETKDDDWNAVIDRAMKEDWVVQEHLNIPIMTVPELVGKKLDFAYKKYNFNILSFGGKYAGSFVRLSDESVINVARGGGLIPSMSSEHVSEHFGA